MKLLLFFFALSFCCYSIEFDDHLELEPDNQIIKLNNDLIKNITNNKLNVLSLQDILNLKSLENDIKILQNKINTLEKRKYIVQRGTFNVSISGDKTSSRRINGQDYITRFKVNKECICNNTININSEIWCLYPSAFNCTYNYGVFVDIPTMTFMLPYSSLTFLNEQVYRISYTFPPSSDLPLHLPCPRYLRPFKTIINTTDFIVQYNNYLENPPFKTNSDCKTIEDCSYGYFGGFIGWQAEGYLDLTN